MLRTLNPWMAGLLKLLLWALAGYAGLCLTAFLLQRRLMYFPSRSSEGESLRLAARMGLVPWRDEAGRLLGWRRARLSRERPRVLILHGNAGDALGRVAFLPVLEAADFEGVLLEYPGYGCRPGEPSQPAMVDDARLALAQLAKEGAPVVLLGESLGSGVAVQVAATATAGVAGLCLVTPFARMAEVARAHYPVLPMGLLLRDRWDGLAAVRAYPGPVAVLLAGQDEVVGALQGRRLAGACPGPVLVLEVPLATHNDLPLEPGSPPWSELLSFLRNALGMGH